jgi:hypothetical protein
MKKLLILAAFVSFSTCANADILLVHGGKLYSVSSLPAPFTAKYAAPTKDQLSKARFVVVNSGDSEPVRVQKVSVMNMVKKPAKADATPAEGCKQNPMRWLKNARHIAGVEYGPEVYAIQVPDGYQESSERTFADACQGGKTVVFKGQSDWLAYELCQDDLNDFARIAKSPLKEAKWTDVTKLTMSDNCP